MKQLIPIPRRCATPSCRSPATSHGGERSPNPTAAPTLQLRRILRHISFIATAHCFAQCSWLRGRRCSSTRSRLNSTCWQHAQVFQHCVEIKSLDASFPRGCVHLKKPASQQTNPTNIQHFPRIVHMLAVITRRGGRTIYV